MGENMHQSNVAGLKPMPWPCTMRVNGSYKSHPVLTQDKKGERGSFAITKTRPYFQKTESLIALKCFANNGVIVKPPTISDIDK